MTQFLTQSWYSFGCFSIQSILIERAIQSIYGQQISFLSILYAHTQNWCDEEKENNDKRSAFEELKDESLFENQLQDNIMSTNSAIDRLKRELVEVEWLNDEINYR